MQLKEAIKRKSIFYKEREKSISLGQLLIPDLETLLLNVDHDILQMSGNIHPDHETLCHIIAGSLMGLSRGADKTLARWLVMQIYTHKRDKTLGSKMHLFHKAVLANLMYCSILDFHTTRQKETYFSEMNLAELRYLATRWGYKGDGKKKKDYFKFLFQEKVQKTKSGNVYSYRCHSVTPSLCAQGNKYLDRIINNPYPLPNIITCSKNLWRPLYQNHAITLESNLKYLVTDVLTNFPDEDKVELFNLKRFKMQTYERKVFPHGVYRVHRK